MLDQVERPLIFDTPFRSAGGYLLTAECRLPRRRSLSTQSQVIYILDPFQRARNPGIFFEEG